MSIDEARMVNFSQIHGTISNKKSSIRMSLRKSSIASLLPKVKRSSSKNKKVQDNQLSAAFNMSSVDFKVDFAICFNSVELIHTYLYFYVITVFRLQC